MNAPARQDSMQQPSIEDDPYFRHLIGQTHKSDAMRAELVACCSAWVKGQLEHHRRAVPALGLTNTLLVGLGHAAGIVEVAEEKLVRFARSVLGAATNPTGPAKPPPQSESALRKIEMLNRDLKRAQAWQACAAPMMETLRDLSASAPDDATRKRAQQGLDAAFPKKEDQWTS